MPLVVSLDTPVVVPLEEALPLNLCTVCKTSARQGGIEPTIMPTKYSALLQIAKTTLSPIKGHLVEDQNEEIRCSTYMLDLFLIRDLLYK